MFKVKKPMKSYLVTVCLWSVSSLAFAESTIEVDIHGMTCGFCVDAVQRNLSKLPDIKQVEVSLASKKLRIQTQDKNIDIERVKQTIVDSGFTPVAVTTLNDE